MTERFHFHFSFSCIGGGNADPLQCSWLENPRDGEAWWAAVYGVTQSRTRLKRRSSSRGNDCFTGEGIGYPLQYSWVALVAQLVKNLPAMRETWVRSLGWEDPLAAAAAKSLQSCPTLCDPIDSSPPGFPVPGILQARTLEWVAISFSNA